MIFRVNLGAAYIYFTQFHEHVVKHCSTEKENRSLELNTPILLGCLHVYEVCLRETEKHPQIYNDASQQEQNRLMDGRISLYS
jgi:hypothetical protein